MNNAIAALLIAETGEHPGYQHCAVCEASWQVGNSRETKHRPGCVLDAALTELGLGTIELRNAERAKLDRGFEIDTRDPWADP